MVVDLHPSRHTVDVRDVLGCVILHACAYYPLAIQALLELCEYVHLKSFSSQFAVMRQSE